MVQTQPVQTNLPKKRSWFKICCFSCLGLVILIILSGISVFAATGLIRIPLFSNIFYRSQPQPIRVVQPEVGYDYEKQLENALRNYTDPKNVKLELSEEALTALIQSGADQADLNKIQVAIEPNYIQIYGIIGKTNATLIAYSLPQMAGGELKNDILKVKIGKIPIPSFLVQSMVSKFGGTNAQSFLFDPEIQIKDFRMESKKIILTLDITNKIKIDKELQKLIK